MRNLVQYPIIANEAISAIQMAIENYTRTIKERGIGDIDGIALLMAERFINDNKERFNLFARASLKIISEDNK